MRNQLLLKLVNVIMRNWAPSYEESKVSFQVFHHIQYFVCNLINYMFNVYWLMEQNVAIKFNFVQFLMISSLYFTLMMRMYFLGFYCILRPLLIRLLIKLCWRPTCLDFPLHILLYTLNSAALLVQFMGIKRHYDIP